MTQPASDKIYLHDSEGGLFSVAPKDVQQAIKPKDQGGMGLVPASDAQVADLMARKEAGSLSGKLKTAASGVASGAIDAFTALPRAGSALYARATGTEDIAKDMTGRNALETGAYVAGGGGLEGAKAAQDFAAAERARAQANPTLAAGSSLVGNVAGAAAGGLGALGTGIGGAVTRGLGGKVAARIAGGIAAGAVEGAPLNLVAAQDQAYIENRQLTGEQAMAALGTGALVGAGVGGAFKGLGELYGAAKTRVAPAFGRGAAPLAGEATAAGDRSAAQRILRTSDADLSKSIEATVGREALPEAAGYAREGVKGRSLQTLRNELHDGAAREMAAATNDSLRAVQRIEDKVTNRGWKLSQIEQHATTFAEDALPKTQALAASIRADVQETIAQLGRDAPDVLKGLASQIEKNEMVIRGAASPAKANLAMDQIRRDLLKTTNAFDRSAARVQNVDAQDLMTVLSRKAGEHYESAQQFLMDKATWGAQGEAQEAVNTAYAELIRAKRNALPAFTQRLEGAEYMGAGIARDTSIAHEGKILGTIRNLGRAEGAVGQRAMDESLTAMKNFTEAAQKYGLDAGDKLAVSNAQKALQTFETKLADVTRKTGALEQAETWLGRSKETQGILAPAAVGSFIAGPMGAAVGSAATFLGNSPQALAKRLMVEEAASRAQRVIGSTLDGFFSGAKKAMSSVGETASRAPAVAARAALPVATALEVFQGKHSTPEAAYKARVEDVLATNQNYGQRIRDNAGHVFGSTADHDPHSVGAAVIATTKAMQYLESKIPSPLLNTNSLTPNASAHPPSRMEIAQYADLYQAVTRPLDVIKALPTGAPTVEQMTAIREVYPRLYDYIRQETMGRLLKLDQAGIEVPIRERIILDTLLDLDGAGEPTFSNSFASKYGPMMTDATDNQEGDMRPPAPRGGGTGAAAKSSTTQTDRIIGG